MSALKKVRHRATDEIAEARTDASLAAILRAAGEVLDEHGYDGLSTTAVAQRASVSTGTLYRYYSDKRALLRALFVHLQSMRAAAIGDIYDTFAKAQDWRRSSEETVRTAYRLRLEQAGARSARRAMQSSPELWKLDLDENHALAARFARALRAHNPSLPKAKAVRIALTAITTTAALLDLACLDPRRGDDLVDEAVAIREAYLSKYLE